ncbi:MAG: 3-hydroxyacyl-CoA dehydrogenase NAD-binding domain-containing protein, partial [Planctomycetaceae bacterium]
MSIRTNYITVLGAGVLGAQIAFQSAFKGKRVTCYTPFEEELPKAKESHRKLCQNYKDDLNATDQELEATLLRLTYTTDLQRAASNADIVMEVVPEVPEIKQKTYRQLAPHLPEHTVVLSNSSTLLPSDFADATGRPEKFSALHFANEIWRLNVVEIMGHPGTSRETFEAAAQYAIEIGMVPIAVSKEHPGYVLSYWLDIMLNACQTLVTNGVATAEDIDRTYL